MTQEAIGACCELRLTGCKRPKYIEIHDALLKTNVG